MPFFNPHTGASSICVTIRDPDRPVEFEVQWPPTQTPGLAPGPSLTAQALHQAYQQMCALLPNAARPQVVPQAYVDWYNKMLATMPNPTIARKKKGTP